MKTYHSRQLGAAKAHTTEDTEYTGDSSWNRKRMEVVFCFLPAKAGIHSLKREVREGFDCVRR
jgi:hypothetical protein